MREPTDTNFLVSHSLVSLPSTGFGGHGKITDRQLDDDISMIMVNVVSLVALTHLFAADMVQQGGGRILNVGSTAGFMPVSK